MILAILVVVSLYLASECIFYVTFRFFLLPRADERRHDGCLFPYRDYRSPDARHALMVRILNRMERTCRVTGEDPNEVLKSFLRDWFVEVEDDEEDDSTAKEEEKEDAKKKEREEEERRRATRERQSSSSSSLQAIVRSSGDDDDENDDSNDGPEFLRRDDVDRFFSWAFFDKDVSDLTKPETNELDVLHSVVRNRLDWTFPPGKTPNLEPMRLTLDPIDAVHRPLIVYVAFAILGLAGRVCLRLVGFDRRDTRSGLTYWHRPAPRTSSRFDDDAPDRRRARFEDGDDDALPLLFFHGIAPGGLALYLPVLLWGLIRGGDGASRPAFLFETRPISFDLTLDCLTEEDTIEGVSEALERHLDGDGDGGGRRGRPAGAPVAVAGHSFGSCQVTWLLRCPSLSKRIKQVVLLDPVSILLSEPDVMINFLYKRSYLDRGTGDDDGGTKNQIWVVANELGVEHYLRRNFAWYNSELWLEDVPSGTKVLVCLSERDEIVPSGKVKREIEMRRGGGGTGTGAGGGGTDEITNTTSTGTKGSGGSGAYGSAVDGGGVDNVELIYWERVGHGHCVTCSKCWEDVRNAMRRQERVLRKERSL